jgi:Trm5-related predicted tRNA methylase
MATGQMIILDLVYEGKMNNKENKSLGSQIELILKAIRYVENPPSVHLCNFKGGIKSIL